MPLRVSTSTVSEKGGPGVWAETDKCGMIQLHIGPQTLVVPLQEVFGAPDPDSAVVSAWRQVLPITAEIKARHVATVALKSTWTQIQRRSKSGFREAA